MSLAVILSIPGLLGAALAFWLGRTGRMRLAVALTLIATLAAGAALSFAMDARLDRPGYDAILWTMLVSGTFWLGMVLGLAGASIFNALRGRAR